MHFVIIKGSSFVVVVLLLLLLLLLPSLSPPSCVAALISRFPLLFFDRVSLVGLLPYYVYICTQGPMTQTKFVLSKALARGLKPIVVFNNKMDRDTIGIEEVCTCSQTHIC